MAEITINTEHVGFFTAKLCLMLAEEYAEGQDLRIVGKRMEDGKVHYWFEEGRK